MRPSFFLAALSSLFFSHVASAQYMPQPLLNTGYVNAQVFGETWEEENAVERAGAALSTFEPDQPASIINSANLSYTPSATRTQQNLRTFVERTPEAAGKADLQQMIAAQPNIIEEIGVAVREYGFDPHNVADAYAMWWMNAWLVANKRNDDPNAATITAVKQQARNALAATPNFSSTNDEQRQEFAESLLLQGTMLASAFEQYQGKPELLDQLAATALQGAEATGLEISKMTLTENGFVPRKSADASNAAQEDHSDSSMGFALAAGAGLGLVLLAGGAILRKG